MAVRPDCAPGRAAAVSPRQADNRRRRLNRPPNRRARVRAGPRERNRPRTLAKRYIRACFALTRRTGSPVQTPICRRLRHHNGSLPHRRAAYRLLSSPSKIMKPAAPDDIRLISEIDAGSAEALAELYDRFCHRAVSFPVALGRQSPGVWRGRTSGRTSGRSRPRARWHPTAGRARAPERSSSPESDVRRSRAEYERSGGCLVGIRSRRERGEQRTEGTLRLGLFGESFKQTRRIPAARLSRLA